MCTLQPSIASAHLNGRRLAAEPRFFALGDRARTRLAVVVVMIGGIMDAERVVKWLNL